MVLDRNQRCASLVLFVELAGEERALALPLPFPEATDRPLIEQQTDS